MLGWADGERRLLVPAGIDFAAAQIPAEHIKAAGYAGVVNYVSLSRPGSTFGAKPITLPYARSLAAAGLVIVSNYQYGKPGVPPVGLHSRLRGASPMRALRGSRMRRRRGWPERARVFFTIDGDISRDTWNSVALQWFLGNQLGFWRSGRAYYGA